MSKKYFIEVNSFGDKSLLDRDYKEIASFVNYGNDFFVDRETSIEAVNLSTPDRERAFLVFLISELGFTKEEAKKQLEFEKEVLKKLCV